MIFCMCGCNKKIKNNKMFIRGHNRKNKHHSFESCQKIKMSHIGKKMSEETKEKLRKFNLGRKHSEETKEKLRNRKFSEETRQKLRITHLGKKNPKLSQILRGRKLSEEHKRKISKSEMGKKLSEEHKRKISNGNLNKKRSEEIKQKMSDRLRGKVGENSRNWRGGKSFEPYCYKFNHTKREEIRNQYDRKCYLCSKDEKDNITKTNKQYKLSVHHIDLDKEQGCNGKQWKLVPLCLHCHMKSHNKMKEIK